MLNSSSWSFLLPVVWVTLIATVLSRFLNQSEAAVGLRQALGDRSALLAKLFSCSRCLCFWLSLVGAAAFADTFPGLVMYWGAGWLFSFRINRKLDQRSERVGEAPRERSCRVCCAPYKKGFLERFDAYFCSYACWFEYLKSRPSSLEGLVGPSGVPLPQEIYNMPWKDIDADEAQRLLASDSGYVYLDVRSVPEFDNGHPAGAYNIPLFHRDQTEMVPNRDFLRVAQIVFDHATRLIVGCQSGVRSRHAAEALSTAGFAEVYNLRGGFGGARDVQGQLVAKGWFESGFAVEYGADASRSYGELGVRV